MGVELREGRVSGVPFSQCGLGIHVLHTTCMSIDGVVTCGGYSLWLHPVGRGPRRRARAASGKQDQLSALRVGCLLVVRSAATAYAHSQRHAQPCRRVASWRPSLKKNSGRQGEACANALCELCGLGRSSQHPQPRESGRAPNPPSMLNLPAGMIRRAR